MWQQLLQLPFTTPGGQKALGIAALIALFYLGVHLLLVSAKPKETQRGPAIVPRGNGAPYQPAPGPAPGDEPGNVRDPIQIRDERSTDAREDLLKIQEALMAYAAANNAFPTELSDDLRELSGFGGFGDMTRYLTRFEGHRLTAYRRTLSGDFRTDSVEIEALPRGLRRSIKASFVFERMAVNLPKPPPNWGDPNFTFPGER